MEDSSTRLRVATTALTTALAVVEVRPDYSHLNDTGTAAQLLKEVRRERRTLASLRDHLITLLVNMEISCEIHEEFLLVDEALDGLILLAINEQVVDRLFETRTSRLTSSGVTRFSSHLQAQTTGSSAPPQLVPNTSLTTSLLWTPVGLTAPSLSTSRHSPTAPSTHPDPDASLIGPTTHQPTYAGTITRPTPVSITGSTSPAIRSVPDTHPSSSQTPDQTSGSTALPHLVPDASPATSLHSPGIDPVVPSLPTTRSAPHARLTASTTHTSPNSSFTATTSHAACPTSRTCPASDSGSIYSTRLTTSPHRLSSLPWSPCTLFFWALMVLVFSILVIHQIADGNTWRSIFLRGSPSQPRHSSCRPFTSPIRFIFHL